MELGVVLDAGGVEGVVLEGLPFVHEPDPRESVDDPEVLEPDVPDVPEVLEPVLLSPDDVLLPGVVVLEPMLPG